MPIEDPVKRRAYFRNRYRTLGESDERRADKRRYNAALRGRRAESLRELRERAGGRCHICGTTIDDLVFHRRDFRRHPRPCSWKQIAVLEKELDKYALLCRECHTGVHWLTKNSTRRAGIETLVAQKHKL